MAITALFADGFDFVAMGVNRGIAIKYDSFSVEGFGNKVTGFNGVGQAEQYSGTQALMKYIDPAVDTYLLSWNQLFTNNAAGAAGGDWPLMVGDWPGGLAGNNNFPFALTVAGTSSLTWQLWTDCNLIFFAPNGIYSGRSVSDPGNTKTIAWTDSAPLNINQWYSIQLKFTISTKHIELFIDGSLKFSGNFTMSGPFQQIQFRRNGNTALGFWQIDNLAILAASNPSDTWDIFPLVTGVVMNANGTNNWTRNTNAYGSNNFNVINEYQGDGTGRDDPDGDVSYNVSTALNEESYFSDVTVIPGTNAVFLNATWAATSGTQGLKGSFGGSVIGPEITQIGGAQNDIFAGYTITGRYYKTTQWVHPTSAAGNWGVQQTSGATGVLMTWFYLEALAFASPVVVTVTCPIVGTGTVGTPYAGGSIVASGGAAPYVYAGSMPPGLTLNTGTGAITGTPTVPGVYPYTAQATDNNGIVGTAPCSFTITGSSSLSLACPVSSAAVVGVPYVGTLIPAGGVPGYTFTLIAGTLPPGLSLNGSTGVISGTPTLSASYLYTAQVEDTVGSLSPASCGISVSPFPGICVVPPNPTISSTLQAQNEPVELTGS